MNLLGCGPGTPMAKILVSYRRSDSAAMAGRICDRLTARYGSDAVFLDIDSIPFAIDFRDHVRDTLRQSDVVIAVVGPRWAGRGEDRVRIQDEDDPVRVEIELTLQSSIPLLPVLVDGAVMPKAADLPESLKRFAFINAAPVDTGRDFHQHMDRLIAALDRILGAKAGPTGPVARTPTAPPVPAKGVRDWLLSPAPWAVLGIVAVPFGAAYGALTPAWPPGVEIVSAILGVVAFMLVAHWLRGATTGAINRIIVIAAIVLGLSSAAYMLVASIYIYQVPTTKERWTKGFTCSPEAQLLYKHKCPHLGVDELRGAEYEAERLWTVQSIAMIKVALLTMWLAACLSLAALVGGLSMHYTRAQTPANRAALEYR
jgi:TIR domain